MSMEAKAFTAFFEQYRPAIVRMARRWVQADDAEDVAQDVLQYIHQFGQRTSLRLLVRNFCVAILRRSVREVEATAHHQAAEAGMVKAQAQHLVDMADTTAHLAKAVTDPMGSAVLAGLAADKSERKMAAELKVGRSVVRGRKKKLKKLKNNQIS
jgi:DNA-directed RNA polymerase specialized sigma24 family protein